MFITQNFLDQEADFIRMEKGRFGPFEMWFGSSEMRNGAKKEEGRQVAFTFTPHSLVVVCFFTMQLYII